MKATSIFAGLTVPTAPDWTLELEKLQHLPWVVAMAESTQDPVMHAEGDVWTHTCMVVEALVGDPAWRALDPARRQALFWAALLHDVAKPQTRIVEDGHVRNPSHSRIGSLEARAMLWQAGVDRSVREAACAIISVHQAPFWLVERKQWQVDYILALMSLSVEPADVAIHARADALGRVCPDQERMLESVEMFLLMAQDMNACYPGTHLFSNHHARVRYFADPEHRNWMETPPDMTSSDFRVFMTSGLPGSGKSTVAAELQAQGMPVICLDDLREELGMRNGDNPGTMIQVAQERARVHLRLKRSFVWDSTNLTRDQRGRVLSLAHAYGAQSSILNVERSWKETMQGNREREDYLPLDAMNRMLAKWEPPTLAECHELSLVQPEAKPSMSVGMMRRP